MRDKDKVALLENKLLELEEKYDKSSAREYEVAKEELKLLIEEARTFKGKYNELIKECKQLRDELADTLSEEKKKRRKKVGGLFARH